MPTKTRMEDDVRSALQRDPRIKHPEVIADDLKVHPPIRARRLDDEIRAAALQGVLDDSRIRSSHIRLKVSHGWVTLTGYVREDSERAAAVDDVASISGVAGVTDQIEVR